MKLFKSVAEAISRYDDAHNFTCDNCGREVFDGRRLCEACRQTLPYNDKEVCPLCGRRVRESGICMECKEKPLSVDKARSLWIHEGDAAKLVRLFKTGSKYLFRMFAEETAPFAEREFAEVDSIVFVPMTEKDRKKRGYNQSYLLAKRLAEKTGKNLLDVLEKRRDTVDQRELTRREREENMKGAFAVTDKAAVCGRRILIADDTLTTGATVDAIALALKNAGAERVFAVTATSVEKKYPYGIKN